MWPVNTSRCNTIRPTVGLWPCAKIGAVPPAQSIAFPWISHVSLAAPCNWRTERCVVGILCKFGSHVDSIATLRFLSNWKQTPRNTGDATIVITTAWHQPTRRFCVPSRAKNREPTSTRAYDAPMKLQKVGRHDSQNMCSNQCFNKPVHVFVKYVYYAAPPWENIRNEMLFVTAHTQIIMSQLFWHVFCSASANTCYNKMPRIFAHLTFTIMTSQQTYNTVDLCFFHKLTRDTEACALQRENSAASFNGSAFDIGAKNMFSYIAPNSS